MEELLDLGRYPLHKPESEDYTQLVQRCREALDSNGMYDLPGFFHDHVVEEAAEAVKPAMATEAYLHARTHNAYFEKSVPGLSDDHPALKQVKTINHTLCADQLRRQPGYPALRMGALCRLPGGHDAEGKTASDDRSDRPGERPGKL